MMGVLALEEWCRREVSDYPGVKITDMSSSWRDGLAFCALIHKHTNNVIHWDSLDPSDWHGNCDLAFTLAETELGIPQLLDVDYVVRSESPDQFFIMTYVAQFYHKFSVTDSGYDSTFNTSFKYSSSEEDSPRRTENQAKRRGLSSHYNVDGKKRRPTGMVVSGGLELRLDSPEHEKKNVLPKLYDADDEEGESSEVLLSRGSGAITEARNATENGNIVTGPHQDLVLKRKRPNSLNRVSNSSSDKEAALKWTAERRSCRRASKAKLQEVVGNRRRIIGLSDYPKPYKQRDSQRTECYGGLSEKRREHSIDSEENSSQADNPISEQQLSNESLKEKIRSIPNHISESQKLLKTSIFQMPAPQYPTKCLILNIYQIKQPQFEDKSTSPPPPEFCAALQQSLQEIDHILKSKNSLQQSVKPEIDHILKPPRESKNLEQTEKLTEPPLEDDKRHERELCRNTWKEDGQMFAKLTRQDKIQKFLSRNENRIPMNANKNSLTPRSRSKFEHLIKNLRESNEDEQLVIYKVLESQPSPAISNKLKITDVVPYKGEPKDKYTVEFLWNIGAANYVGSGNTRKHHRYRRRR